MRSFSRAVVRRSRRLTFLSPSRVSVRWPVGVASRPRTAASWTRESDWIVPEEPTHVLKPVLRTASVARLATARIAFLIALRSRSLGGSSRRYRSASRTTPSGRLSVIWTREPSEMTNSVEPPPMSMRKSGSKRAGNSLRTPRLMSRASSSPETTSTVTPVRRRTASRKAAELEASRTAQVATARTRSAPAAWIERRNCSTASDPRLDGLVRQAARGEGLAAQAHQGLLARHHLQRSVLFDGGDQQLDAVGSDVDGGELPHHRGILRPGRGTALKAT